MFIICYCLSNVWGCQAYMMHTVENVLVHRVWNRHGVYSEEGADPWMVKVPNLHGAYSVEDAGLWMVRVSNLHGANSG